MNDSNEDYRSLVTKIKPNNQPIKKQMIVDNGKRVTKDEFQKKYMISIRDYQKEYEKQQEEKRRRDEEIYNYYYNREVSFHSYDYIQSHNSHLHRQTCSNTVWCSVCSVSKQ